jgi:hypothetical protein
MSTVTLNVVVGEDRHLAIDLPDEIPAGPIEVTIRTLAVETGEVPAGEMTRERARALLAAAGRLSTARYAPPDAEPLTDEEREEIGREFGALGPVSELIIEDRGSR